MVSLPLQTQNRVEKTRSVSTGSVEIYDIFLLRLYSDEFKTLLIVNFDFIMYSIQVVLRY